MYKKIISVMSVALVVFLCSFPAFAVTSGGKTIVTNSYSYNNGDVTLYARVNGHKNDEEYTGGDRIYSYQHAFTVTLANNTNEFQVAETNSFTVDLYTGYTDTFAATTTNTPSGSSMYRPSWGSEVTTYSDNMSAPRVLMYPSGDNAGHVLISFEDSDLLVLNPNETREYTFTINFNMSYDGLNQFPINGNAQYSYFTYAGSVSMYSRPSGFSGNTINDFMANDSLPNSAIAYYQYLIQQGIEDQELYDQIISLLSYQNVPNLGMTNRSGTYLSSNLLSYNNNTLPTYVRRTIYSPYYDQRNIISDPSLDNTTIESTLWVVPVHYHIGFFNINSYSYDYWYLRFVPSSPFNNQYFVGSDITYLSDYYTCFNVGYTQYEIHGDVDENRHLIIPNGYSYIDIVVYYYFNVPNGTLFTPSINNFTVDFTNGSYDINSVSSSSSPFFYGLTRGISNIINRLQQILNAYNDNAPAADDVTDNSESVSDTVDTQHETEANYFEDSQTAITDTGIQNFQFDSNTLGGLGGIKDDFTAVWTSCGTLAQYWIASLTIGLALSIIRHRRMFSHD